MAIDNYHTLLLICSNWHKTESTLPQETFSLFSLYISAVWQPSSADWISWSCHSLLKEAVRDSQNIQGKKRNSFLTGKTFTN